MNIEDMEANKNYDTFECEVVIVNNANEYDRDGVTRRVQDLVVKDSTGKTITLVLWGSQTHEACKWGVGDKLIIINAYCKEYQGNLQLSTGKLGYLTRMKPEEKKKKGKKK